MLKRPASVAVLILVILMIVGTFYDYQIAVRLYNPDNRVAIFMEHATYVPMFYLVYFSLFMLGRHLHDSPIIRKKRAYALLLVVYVMATLTFAIRVAPYADSTWRYVLVTVPPMTALAAFFAALVPVDEFRRYTQLCLLYLIFFILMFPTVHILKINFTRERFLFLETAADYTMWFMPQSGDAGFRFRSFPSGHTASGAHLIWFIFIPYWFERHRKYFYPTLIAITLWAVLAAGSRLILGMHYLTDVTFSLLLSVLLFAFLHRYLFKDGFLRKYRP